MKAGALMLTSKAPCSMAHDLEAQACAVSRHDDFAFEERVEPTQNFDSPTEMIAQAAYDVERPAMKLLVCGGALGHALPLRGRPRL